MVEHFPGLHDLLSLYEEIDSRTRSFSETSGLKCLPHCGTCCCTPSKNIETTIFETLPLALSLWGQGRAEHMHQAAVAASGQGVCVIFNEALIPRIGGGCSAYATRPLICRLFGFTSVKDKHGGHRLSLCRRKINTDPALAMTGANLLAAGTLPPSMTEYASRARALNPSHAGSHMQGINESLRLALETVMFKADMLGLKPEIREDGSTEPTWHEPVGSQ